MFSKTKSKGSKAERRVIRKVFSKNRGAAAQVARELGIHRSSITLWLLGDFDSERIAVAMSNRAELLSKKAA